MDAQCPRVSLSCFRDGLNIPPPIFVYFSACSRAAPPQPFAAAAGSGDEERGEAGENQGLEEGVAIGNPRPDQCHGAFIVLQQKGAHQSTGISSRLISRGHPRRLARRQPLRRVPTLCRSLFSTLLSRNTSLSLAFSGLRVLHSFFQPLDDRHPSPGVAVVAAAAGERRRRGWQIAGRRSAAAVVMKTYEIYSIWADAITPPTADNPRRPSPPRAALAPVDPSRIYTCIRTRSIVR